MARYTLVVLTNAVEGQDDEYNDWYDNTHLHDVLALNGYVAAQRFRLTESGPPQEYPHRYLALYEVETDDLVKVHQGLLDAAETPAMLLSPALSTTDAVIAYFTPITERRVED